MPSSSATASIAFMELGALVCTSRAPRCGDCPVIGRCAWVLAGRPALDAPVRRPQGYAGTDRQVRGRLLGVIRDSLAVLLASFAEHALAGLAHLPDAQRLPVDRLVHRDMPIRRRAPVVGYLATVSVPALPPSRKGWAVAARMATAIVVVGGFGTLCLSYALACVTISSVLLGALA